MGLRALRLSLPVTGDLCRALAVPAWLSRALPGSHGPCLVVTGFACACVSVCLRLYACACVSVPASMPVAVPVIMAVTMAEPGRDRGRRRECGRARM